LGAVHAQLLYLLLRAWAAQTGMPLLLLLLQTRAAQHLLLHLLLQLTPEQNGLLHLLLLARAPQAQALLLLRLLLVLQSGAAQARLLWLFLLLLLLQIWLRQDPFMLLLLLQSGAVQAGLLQLLELLLRPALLQALQLVCMHFCALLLLSLRLLLLTWLFERSFVTTLQLLRALCLLQPIQSAQQHLPLLLVALLCQQAEQACKPALLLLLLRLWCVVRACSCSYCTPCCSSCCEACPNLVSCPCGLHAAHGCLEPSGLLPQQCHDPMLVLALQLRQLRAVLQLRHLQAAAGLLQRGMCLCQVHLQPLGLLHRVLALGSLDRQLLKCKAQQLQQLRPAHVARSLQELPGCIRCCCCLCSRGLHEVPDVLQLRLC
jgi:hypothetical protein